MPTSLFRRVTRYQAGVVDPRENRLTEVFASVLERVPGLASDLARFICTVSFESDPVVTVVTQKVTATGGFVDLELRFRQSNHQDVVVWIEVKHGADVHALQLETYAEDVLVELAGEAHLVLLAPRQSMPTATSGFVAVEWQTVGAFLKRWRKASTADPIHAWLISELIDYLKEESLADEEALTPAHILSFAARPAAERAIARVIEVADLVVVEGWGPREGYSKKGNSPNYGQGWYCNHAVAREGQPSPTTWRSTHFEWTFREDRARADGRDGFVFCAGATFENQDNPTALRENQGWLATLSSNDEFERVQDWYWRLWRFLYPEQLMVEQDIASQGRVLGQWVVSAFDTLANTPPPY